MIWITPKNIYLSGLDRNGEQVAPTVLLQTVCSSGARDKNKSPGGATCKICHCIHANIFQE